MSSANIIEIKNVSKEYDGKAVVKNESIAIKRGEFVTILGPSGCGKTTTLRMIAGFNSIEHGTISFDDKVINEIPVYKRNFGMVFQNYAIFPNMTVYKNIEYGLKNKKLSKAEIKRRIDDILEAVQITQYKDRYPNKLSGGQQQRVALARAIVVQPEVLLLDESTSALDPISTAKIEELVDELRHRYTVIMVTHSQHDSTYAHRVLHLFDGELVKGLANKL